MYDIIHIRGNTYCINTGMTYIPFYRINEHDVILLDSGWAKGEQLQLVELFEVNKFNVTAIINSHSHRDHAGNNSFFKEKYNCIISMESFAAHICSSITHLKQYYHRYPMSELKEHYGHLVFDTDIIIQKNQNSVYIEGIKFNIVHTPGHSPGHICIITPDDVAYLGDALITDVVMKGTKLPYAYHLEEDLKSKKKLLSLNNRKYIIAHKGILDSVDELVQDNIRYYTGRADSLLKLITEPMTLEDIMKKIVVEWNIRIQSTNKYIVVERMLRYYVEYLYDINEVKLIIENGFLKYVRVED